jgi:2-oxo-4-hydroxy-4-carboxy-5-ureidoimidazoline decarboxylase
VSSDDVVLDSLPVAMLRARLEHCCGSARWVEAMLQRRPFGTADAVRAAADAAFAALAPDDWRAAFAAADAQVVAAADEGTRAAAELTLRLYRERYGYPFVVAGRRLAADELLMRVRIRLGNDEESEFGAAREEQRRLTRQRLDELLDSGAQSA